MQLRGRFCKVWMNWNAGHGADLNTLGLIKMTYALGATIRVNLVDGFTHKYSVIGALGFTYVAVDTFVGNHECHRSIIPDC